MLPLRWPTTRDEHAGETLPAEGSRHIFGLASHPRRLRLGVLLVFGLPASLIVGAAAARPDNPINCCWPSLLTSPNTSSPAGTVSRSTHATSSSNPCSRIRPSTPQCPAPVIARCTSSLPLPAISARRRYCCSRRNGTRKSAVSCKVIRGTAILPVCSAKTGLASHKRAPGAGTTRRTSRLSCSRERSAPVCDGE